MVPEFSPNSKSEPSPSMAKENQTLNPNSQSLSDYNDGNAEEIDVNGSADASETSSSFGDTTSMIGDDDDDGYGQVVNEAQSQFRVDHGLGGFDLFRTRNKKLTAHWRKFIRPLMWRCKWMELQIKNIQSQALKYDRELAEYDERKKIEFDRSESEEFDAKSHPFGAQFRRNKAMKRRKRKRVEDSIDRDSYMSQHNFFSYYENKKSGPHVAVVQFDLAKNTYHDAQMGVGDEFSLQFQDREGSMEPLLRKIESLRSQVRNLTMRVDKVAAENLMKSTAWNKLSIGIPQNEMGGSVHPEENGKALRVESRSFLCDVASAPNVDGRVMIDGVITSRDEVTPCSNMIRNAAFAKLEDEVLIDNEQAKKELNDFEKFRDQFGEKLLKSEEQTANPLPLPALERDSVPSKANVKPKGRKRKRKTPSRR